MTTAPSSPIPAWRAIGLVARGVFIEVLRRKELYVLSILMMLYVVGALIVRLVGVESESVSAAVLNLGMVLAYYAALLLSGLTAARQIPAELEQRTLYPLLGKPLARGSYFLGKWAASAAIGVVTLAVLTVLAYGVAPRLSEASMLLLAQTLTLAILSVLAVTSLALTLSLLLPVPVNVLLLAMLVAGTDTVVGLGTRLVGDGGFARLVEWTLHYLPNFSHLNTITRYTDGIGAIAPGDFLALIAYALIYTGLALSAGTLLFERKPL